MPAFRSFVVTEILEEHEGLQRVRVGDERAYALTDLTGPIAVGDEVVCNTTAVDLGLGTGGWHVVHWNLSRRAWSRPGPGHIMKLRYTSTQTDAGAVEEHRGADLDAVPDLVGVPVVACSLHSQVPCVAAGFALAAPGGRLVYVMTDGAALPAVMSDLIRSMRAVGLVHSVTTAGHAFGGDDEAVGLASALVAARALRSADAVVVGMGPGVVGTSSRLGTTALEVAPILDTAAALGATPIAALRVSDADPRPRHRPVSHHTLTALDLVRSPVTMAVPEGENHDDLVAALGTRVDRHRVARVPVGDVVGRLSDAGIRVTSMGRGADVDPRFHLAAGAAGALAGRLVMGPNPPDSAGP